ncbi:hypothetical protein [Paenibacillus alvei]|uniref:hypothetical protein n=1 Tax=Paenibacillus alvei TaxID=44250 RepID=UPI0018CE51D5|nr:hypothetical protein [Paenibacillus alvei]MCY9582539.1 hypothetical protein [Paenibacillus alvei]MCY9583605.1 hypothetical protein [Paenibacillus alvei]
MQLLITRSVPAGKAEHFPLGRIHLEYLRLLGEGSVTDIHHIPFGRFNRVVSVHFAPER